MAWKPKKDETPEEKAKMRAEIAEKMKEFEQKNQIRHFAMGERDKPYARKERKKPQ